MFSIFSIFFMYLQTGPFKMESGMVTIFNQQLWLLCKIQIHGLTKKGFVLEKEMGVSVKIMGRNKDSSYKMISHAFHNRTRMLQCTAKVCKAVFALFITS